MYEALCIALALLACWGTAAIVYYVVCIPDELDALQRLEQRDLFLEAEEEIARCEEFIETTKSCPS